MIADDPEEILRALPAGWHERFMSDYHAALDAAHDVWRFKQLGEVLHLWRLRATAFADLNFDAARQAAAGGRQEEFVPAGDVIPGWLDGVR